MKPKKQYCLIVSDENPNQEPRIRNFIIAMSSRFDFKLLTPDRLDDWPHIYINQPYSWNKHHNLPSMIRKPFSGLLRIIQHIRLKSVRIDAFLKEHEILWTNPVQDLGKIDLVFCTHPWMAPLAKKYSQTNRAKLVCDLFEYYPDQFPADIQSHRAKALVKRQLIRATHFVDRFIVASDNFIPEYQQFMNVEFTFFPCAIPFSNPTRSGRYLAGTQKKRIVHHGTANPSRKIESMIHSIGRNPSQYEGDFFLIFPRTHPEYEKTLHKIADRYSNVSIKKPFSADRLIATLSEYDVGMFILPPLSKNQELLLPNKVFDFIQARLFLVIGPSRGFEDLILNYNIGIVAADFSDDSIDTVLNELKNVDWQAARNNLDRAARELSLEKLSADLTNDLDRLMKDKNQ